ncbi:hypothetical protein ALC56_02572 [Trachymyrmex septentrionalis]|uniref:Mos1 transposase HTH domain-containing protein n=1 Tax=Trachymyrmex septentrionalis TaxID=34720 RepID=A0A195FQA4_9HYME|nr:hypothetical protein ALC56_02572 [Trachymyrmex septentrionalis]
MIEKVCNFVANDRNASLKMMEEALNINRETIRTILHEDLGKTKVCAKFVPHTLRSDQFCVKFNHCSLFHIKISTSTKILFNMNCDVFVICQPK